MKPDLDPLIDKDNKAGEPLREAMDVCETQLRAFRTRSSSRESPRAGKSTRRAKALRRLYKTGERERAPVGEPRRWPS